MTFQILYSVFRGIDIFLRLIDYVLLGYCILSWVARPTNSLYIFLSRLAQPFIAPFRPIARKLIERGVLIDISALLAIFSLDIVRRLIWNVFYWLVGLI